MMYSVRIEKPAEKALSKLPKSEIEKIRVSILELSLNPRPFGCKKLKGREGYRIRVGNYRIIYEVLDDVLVVIVVTVGNRKEVYK